MRTIACLGVVVGVLLPGPLMGQSWTTAEQEIIELNQRCWDAWAAEDLNAVRNVCNEHRDARGWWTAESVPSIGWFDKNAEEFLSHLRKANDELLEGRWVMTFSGQSFIDGPRHDALRTWAISHMIHHRAQLALYLRLMGAKVPGCYGPTADDAPPAG